MSSTASSSSPSKKQRLSLPVPVRANNATKGPIVAANNHEEDRKARAVLTQLGVDPEEDINKEYSFALDDDILGPWLVTPLIHFCRTGNLSMCQYVLSRGADSRKSTKSGSSPMHWAARHDHLEICKLLFHYGGSIRKQNLFGDSPLRMAFYRRNYDAILWMIPNGAFSPRQDDVIDDMMMRNELSQINDVIPNWEKDERLTVLARAHDVVNTHGNFKLFLKGTIISTRSTTATTTSPLVMFKGTSGILEVIANYVGIPSAHDVRMFRQLVVLLTAFIEDEPFDRERIKDYDDSEDDDDIEDDDDY